MTLLKVKGFVPCPKDNKESPLSHCYECPSFRFIFLIGHAPHISCIYPMTRTQDNEAEERKAANVTA